NPESLSRPSAWCLRFSRGLRATAVTVPSKALRSASSQHRHFDKWSSGAEPSCSLRSAKARDGTGTGGCLPGSSAYKERCRERDTSHRDRNGLRRGASREQRLDTSIEDPTSSCYSRPV